MEPLRVAVVEDNVLLGEELVGLLAEAGYESRAFAAAGCFRARHQIAPFDLLILGLADSDGIDIVRALHEERDPVGIIILSGQDGLKPRIRGLTAGADAWLGKPFEFDDLLAHMGAVQRRIRRRGPDDDDRWVLDVLKLRLLAPSRGEVMELTVSEACLMRAIVEHHPAHVSRAELVKSLGEDFRFYDERRLEKLVSRLRKKIKGTFGESPIRTVRSKGYVFAEKIHLVGA